MNTITYEWQSKESIKKLILEIFDEQNLTPIGQKHFLTRNINSEKRLLKDLEIAHARPFNDRWYLGDRVTITWVTNVRNEIQIMQEMRDELQKKYKGNIIRADWEEAKNYWDEKLKKSKQLEKQHMQERKERREPR